MDNDELKKEAEQKDLPETENREGTHQDSQRELNADNNTELNADNNPELNADNKSALPLKKRAGGFRTTKTAYICTAALFTALTYIVTMFLNIPAAAILGAGGNINLGDAVIFCASIVLGPVGGAVSGALGASLADISSAYIVYAPFTAVVKGLAGFLCGFLYRYVFKRKKGFIYKLIPIIAAALVIIVGYFFSEILILLFSGSRDTLVNVIAGARTLVPNLVQVTCSGVIALVLSPKLPEL